MRYIYDIECYPNYFYAFFKSLDKEHKDFEIEIINPNRCLSDMGGIPEQLTELITVIGYNSKVYDHVMLKYALQDKTVKELADISKQLIEIKDFKKRKLPVIFKSYPNIVNIDIRTIIPNYKIYSLKQLASNMHYQTIEELPYEIKPLTVVQMDHIKSYCKNDVLMTKELYYKLRDRVLVRKPFVKEFGKDILSASDSNIAEKYFSKAFRLSKNIEVETKLRYNRCRNLPALSTKHHGYSDALKYAVKTEYEYNKKTKKIVGFEPKIVEINKTKYKFGIGGLHSQEEDVHFIADDEYLLYDIDVASYYPNIIINNSYFPERFTFKFIDYYKQLVSERLAAKSSGDIAKSEVLKVVINGTFGKLGSEYSILFSPKSFLHVVISGQLYLLNLISHLEEEGVRVISANTDGVMCIIKKKEFERIKSLIKEWGETAKFEFEFTQYKSVFITHVNSYFAIKSDGSIKAKGAYVRDDITKTPKGEIIQEAAIESIINNKSIEEIVNDCNDIRKFIYSFKSGSNCFYRGKDIGKMIRWYFSRDGNTIYTKHGEKNISQVPDATDCIYIPDLPDKTPDDIDRKRYIDKAEKIKDSFLKSGFEWV